MNDITKFLPLNTESQDLPNSVTTRSGVKFDPRVDRWSFRDNVRSVSLNFKKLNASSELLLSIKKTLIWYAENKSSGYVNTLFETTKHFLSTIQEISDRKIITSYDLINYKSALDDDKSSYLGQLSIFLRKMDSLGNTGISQDAVLLLNQLRIKGRLKGKAILTMDVNIGPYSDIEFESIFSSASINFSIGKLSLESYCLILLYICFGSRNTQMASLKLCDFEILSSKDNGKIYSINIPRAKQEDELTRSSFKLRKFNTQIGEIFSRHVSELKSKFASILDEPSQAPMFPAKFSTHNPPSEFRFHKTSGSLGLVLKKALNTLSITSERTGKPLNCSAVRFRRTLATRAAMEGHGELIIAELLDHSDTQHVGVYVQATPQIVERIDKAMSMQLAPLAQAFSGMIIKNESEATRANDPTSRICDPRFDSKMKPMGNCGEFGFCGELAPIACYTCRKFEPWLDGPHEKVLDHLISERERLLKATDERIASINDRTILAVAEVVRRCYEINSQESNNSNG